jgi:hypothetical protein
MSKEKHKEEVRTYSFDEKVRSMSAKEIIMAMVNGLKNPAVKVDMGSFGRFSEFKIHC